jgi:omega-amidase
VQDLTVTLLQTSLAWHDPAANRVQFDGLLAALEQPTDLVVLPEMFTTGFTMDAKNHAETMDGESVSWMKLMAQDFAVTLCGSLIIEADGRYFNRLIWASPDGTASWYDKRHLFRMADEQEHYTAGNQRAIFTINDWRICPLVCYDLRFPAWSRGADEFELLIYVANWPATRRSAWRTLLPARAVENLCYSVGVNRIEIDGKDVRYVGDSGAYDYLGNPIVDCGDQVRSETICLNRAALDRYRKKFPAHLDADGFHLDE